MKKMLSLLAASAVMCFYSMDTIAQLPIPTVASTKITKIARNASGQILANGTISVRLTVSNGSNTYTETFSDVAVNNLGFFTVTIGTGTTTGTLNSVALDNDTKITTEIDTANSTDFKIIAENKYLDVAATTQAFGVGINGQVLTTNGVGGTSWTAPSVGGLTNLTESAYGDGTTINYGSKLSAKNGVQTNVDLVLSPKGTGALIANQPDGIDDGGGNKRGNYAVDLQMTRNNKAQVASGPGATISGGWGNTASGNYSIVGGGNFNTAGGNSSTVCGGGSNTITDAGIASTVCGGQFNNASGFASTVGGGGNNTTSGDYSFATGLSNTAQSYGETVLGLYATVGGGIPNNPAAGDRLFVVGNGTAWNARSNALTILKNANTTIGGSLTINGNGTSYTFPTGRGTSGQYLKTNADGTTAWATAGLTNFTESRNTTAPNDTKPAHILAATGTGNDLDMVITPKGNGALLADQPDGAVSGGNKRGFFAVDMQLGRLNADEVASGGYAVVSGGQANKASGDNSTVAGGLRNKAESSFNVVSGGADNTAGYQFATVSGGKENRAYAYYSTVVGGWGNKAESYGETVLGLFATELVGDRSAYIATDRLFVVGNGNPTTTARSNALTILKNGNTTIAGSLTINGNGSSTSYTLPTTRGSNNQVLTTDGSGATSWATPAGGSNGGFTLKALVYLSSDVTPTASTSSKISFNTEVVDVDNAFSGGTYSTPTSGIYMIKIHINRALVAIPAILELKQNGIVVASSTSSASATSVATYQGSDLELILSLNAGDTLEGYIGTNTSTAAIKGGVGTQISIIKVQ